MALRKCHAPNNSEAGREALQTLKQEKKLTITIDEQIYEGLYRVVGPRRISRFIEDLVRPHVTYLDLEAAYQQMAQDEERESLALEWAEATVGDVGDEAW